MLTLAEMISLALTFYARGGELGRAAKQNSLSFPLTVGVRLELLLARAS